MRGWNASGDWNTADWSSHGGQDWGSGGASSSDWRQGSDDSANMAEEELKTRIEGLRSGYWADDDFMYWSSERQEHVSAEWDDSLGKKGWWRYLYFEGYEYQPKDLQKRLESILASRAGGADSGDIVAPWQNSDKKWNADSGWGGWTDSADSWATNLDRKIDWHGVQLIPVEKNFYEEMPIVRDRTPDEVEEIRKYYDIQVVDVENKGVPNPVTSFVEASLPDWLLQTLDKKGWPSPTPVQIQVWPCALQGRDLIGIAETGSGKTLAYLAPMMVHIVAQEELKAGEGPVGLVLCPTRELAMQINDVAIEFVGPSGLRSTCVYGGVPSKEQGWALQQKNDIVVATPGRFIQLLNERYTNLNRVTYVVLDEADEMLSKGFGEQISLILSQVRPDRQMLMFSATWPQTVQILAKEHCKEEPVIIRIGGDALVACRNISQKIMVVENSETGGNIFDAKVTKLREALQKAGVDRQSDEKCLIFCRTKANCDQLVEDLRVGGIEAGRLHSDMDQNQRSWMLKEFKEGFMTILVATNCLGRGHDIKNVKYVINFDAPENVENYIHRIGRTGRAGNKGISLTFMSNRDAGIALDLIKVLERTDQPVSKMLRDMAESELAKSYNFDSTYAAETTAEQTAPWSSNTETQVAEQHTAPWDNSTGAEVQMQAAWAGYSSAQQDYGMHQ